MHRCGRVGRGLVFPGLLCATWLGLALYGTHTAQPLSPDSAHTAVVARNIVRGHGNTIDWIPFHFGLQDQIRHVPDWHGLLGAPVLAALFGVFGVHDELIRVPGLTYTAATGLVAFTFARVVFGAAAGWLACLLTLGSTGLFHYGWIGTDDSGFAFFFTLTLLLCYLGLEEDDRAIPWAGVAGALAVSQKQTGFYLVAVFLVVLWLGRGRGSGWRWAAWLFVPFAVAVGAYLVRNHASYGAFAFRLGPLNWIFKAEGIPALYRFYPTPPHALGGLGPSRSRRGPVDRLGAVGEVAAQRGAPAPEEV